MYTHTQTQTGTVVWEIFDVKNFSTNNNVRIFTARNIFYTEYLTKIIRLESNTGARWTFILEPADIRSQVRTV